MSVGVDGLPVHHRLAHAHEHDVRDGDRRIEQAHLAHLTGDLERGEVAAEAHRAGRAKRALQRASGLRRDAQRHAIALGNRDGLDRLAVGSRKRNFSVPSVDFCRAAIASRGSSNSSAKRFAERLRAARSSRRSSAPDSPESPQRPVRRDMPAGPSARNTRQALCAASAWT